MVQSKEWNWEVVTEDCWRTPSEDVYYYLHRWHDRGFRCFLDLGCGLGRHALLFAENGFETDAFDLSQDGLDFLNEAAGERGLCVRTMLGDINHLPYVSESFDCLLAYHVISHTDTRGISGIVAEIHRVLRGGGEFFITLCSINSPSYRTKNYPRIDEHTIIKTDEPEVGVPHFYTDLDGVRHIFRDFELIRIRQIEDIFGESSSWHYFIHGRRPA